MPIGISSCAYCHSREGACCQRRDCFVASLLAMTISSIFVSLRAPEMILRMHRKENSPRMSLRRSAATVAISILPQQKPSISLGAIRRIAWQSQTSLWDFYNRPEGRNPLKPLRSWISAPCFRGDKFTPAKYVFSRPLVFATILKHEAPHGGLQA